MKTVRVMVLVICTALGSVLLFLVLLDGVIMPYVVDVDKVEVPDIRRRGMAEAAAYLKRIGLRVVTRDSVFHDRLAVGTIVEQDPAPRSKQIKKGRRVFVDVSKGRRLYEVPQLIGVGERDAYLQLQTQKLRMGRIYYVSSASAPPGAVIRQHPQAFARMQRGERVDLEISSGSPLDPKRVPRLLGLTIDVVEDSLSKYEMDQGEINERLDLGSPPGVVLSQNPRPGSLHMRHTKINIVISVGRATP